MLLTAGTIATKIWDPGITKETLKDYSVQNSHLHSPDIRVWCVPISITNEKIFIWRIEDKNVAFLSSVRDLLYMYSALVSGFIHCETRVAISQGEGLDILTKY